MYFSSKKTGDTEQALDIAQQAIAVVERKVDELTKVAGGVSGTIMEVKDCTRMGQVHCSMSDYPRQRWRFFDLSCAAVCKAATEHANELLAEAKSIHEGNLPAIKNNKALREKVAKTMESIGIPASYRQSRYKTSRSRNATWESFEAGWMEDLKRLVKVSDGWDGQEEAHAQQLKRIEAYRKEKEAEEAKVLKEKEKAEADKAAVLQKAALTVKYKVPYESTWDELLDIMIAKDKYLRLAHYLQLNRGDWSWGYDYAECGLLGFDVETDTDKEIHANISSHFGDEDTDGRCFRDCEWNYGVLFGMADKELHADYQIVVGKVELY